MKKWMPLIPVLALFPAMVLAAGSDLPVEVHASQGIKYYNGGVGMDERARLPQVFPLKIVFATDRGLYLNNADVKFFDSSGKEVLAVRADNGPWLVADLPPGTYRVEATLEGRTVSARSLRVQSGGRTAAILRWKTSDVDMGL